MGETFNESLDGSTIHDPEIDGGSINNTPIGQSVPASGAFIDLQIQNDEWLSSDNYAGSDDINMFKVNTDDEIDVGGTLVMGASIEAAEDSGAVTLVDMPVSDDPNAGDEMSFTIKVDGSNILKVYAEADSSGGIQNQGIVALYQINLKEMTTPTAVTNYGAIYAKADNKLYFQDGAGVEHTVAFV